MTIEQKAEYLRNHGFIVGERNPQINTNYVGKFMVAEWHEALELPTQDGRNGPWAIVGDDLNDLITRAYDDWAE